MHLQGHIPCDRHHCPTLHTYPFSLNPQSTAPGFKHTPGNTSQPRRTQAHARGHVPDFTSHSPKTFRQLPKVSSHIPQSQDFPAQSENHNLGDVASDLTLENRNLSLQSTVPRFQTQIEQHIPEPEARDHTLQGTCS